MKRRLQSLVIWLLFIIVIGCIYTWNELRPTPWNSAEYQSQMRRSATGDRVEDLIQHLDARPLSESIED